MEDQRSFGVPEHAEGAEGAEQPQSAVEDRACARRAHDG